MSETMTPPTAASTPAAGTPAAGPRLELRDLLKRYGGRTVVDVPSLDLGVHRIEGLIGPNGAGKTTLMNVISQRVRADRGTVRFVDRNGSATDVGGRSVDAIARMGVVKTNQLIRDFGGLTIRDSLLLSLATPRHEQPHRVASERALRAASADEIDRYLDYFGLTDADTHALSAGDKKLLDIIRCLLIRPKLLLMDEPTAGLPDDQTRRVMDLISERATADDMAVVIVEHDLGLIWEVCGFVHFMADGHVVEQGTPDVIRTSKLVAEKYLGVASDD